MYKRKRKYVPRRQFKRRKFTRAKRSQLTQELKWFDTSTDENAISSTGVVKGSLNLVPQGTGESERVGRRILVRTVAGRFSTELNLEQNVSDIGPGDIVRIILYCDKQANGGNPAVTDILQTAAYDAFRNLNQKDRFKILHDQFITINRRVAMTDGTNTAQSPIVQGFKFRKYWRLNGLPIEFDGVSGAITTITSNNIGVLYISRQGVGGMLAHWRIRYDG